MLGKMTADYSIGRKVERTADQMAAMSAARMVAPSAATWADRMVVLSAESMVAMLGVLMDAYPVLT